MADEAALAVGLERLHARRPPTSRPIPPVFRSISAAQAPLRPPWATA